MCLALAIVPALRAEELTFELAPEKTQIVFVLTDVLHTVHGQFQLKRGHIAFDRDTRAISGDVVVDAASGNSGNLIRDRRMTRHILEAQRYPEIRFSPARFSGLISPSGASTVQVAGSFLIHGEAHDLTIPMQIQMSRDEITMTGKFIVPYVAWGMRDPSKFFLKVNNQVEIDFTAVGYVKDAHRSET